MLHATFIQPDYLMLSNKIAQDSFRILSNLLYAFSQVKTTLVRDWLKQVEISEKIVRAVFLCQTSLKLAQKAKKSLT